MKTLILALSFTSIIVFAQAPSSRPPGSQYTKMAESDPVRIGVLEFIAVTETEWSSRHRSSLDHIDVQLYVVNRGDSDVLFPTFDTFGVTLKASDGTDLREGGGRDGTLVTKPVLLPPGGRYCLCRKAEISWDRKTNSQMFSYYDGTGSWTTYSPMRDGVYTLRFWLSSSPKKLFDDAGVPVWSGKGTTNEVHFAVIEPRQ